MSKDTCNTNGPHLDPESMVGFLLALRERGPTSNHAVCAFLLLASAPNGMRTKDIAVRMKVKVAASAVTSLQNLEEHGLAYYICQPRCTTWHLTTTGRALADRFLNTNCTNR